MLNLEESLKPLNKENQCFHFRLGENWLQGRSCFGGLSASMGLAAMRKVMDKDRPLRSLQVVFSGPVFAGDVKVSAAAVREGKSISVFNAQILSQDKSGTVVTGVFGEPRATIGIGANDKSDLPTITESALGHSDSAQLPNFISNMDVRWLGDGIPFSGQKSKTLKMWVRLREKQNVSNELKIVTLADTPPPIIASHFTKPIMMSSVTWSIETVRDLNQQNDEWIFIDARLESAGDGYCVQTTEFYNQSGQLLMFGRQNMAYFE